MWSKSPPYPPGLRKPVSHQTQGAPTSTPEILSGGSPTRAADAGNTADASEQPACCICFSRLASPAAEAPAEVGMLECGHRFCLSCIMGWMKLNCCCPLCKKELYVVTEMDTSGSPVRQILVEPEAEDSDEEETLEHGRQALRSRRPLLPVHAGDRLRQPLDLRPLQHQGLPPLLSEAAPPRGALQSLVLRLLRSRVRHPLAAAPRLQSQPVTARSKLAPAS